MNSCQYHTHVVIIIMISTKNTLAVKCSYVCNSQELKKGRDEKEVKSKWVAKASVVLVLMGNKF